MTSLVQPPISRTLQPSCILHHQPRVQRFQPADVTSQVARIQIEVAEVDASHDATRRMVMDGESPGEICSIHRGNLTNSHIIPI